MTDTFRDDVKCMPAKWRFGNHPFLAENLALLQDHGNVARLRFRPRFGEDRCQPEIRSSVVLYDAIC